MILIHSNYTMAQLDHFVVQDVIGGEISTQSVGIPLYIAVLAKDTMNNTVTDFTGTVNITSTGILSAGGGTTENFLNGALDSHMVIFSNAGNFTITATNTDGPETGTSNSFLVNNPVPTMTSISPMSKTVGESGFVLTVNGTNFVDSSIVQFNGSNRTTTFVSSTQLIAAILQSDLTTKGTFPITVSNPSPGGGTSNVQPFTVNNPIVNVKLLLQGPYNGSGMNTTLNNDGLIPLNQPYNTPPWNYAGTESVTVIPNNVADWVLVELRSGTTSSTTAARRAAFITSDGFLVDTDGTSPVEFFNASAGNYYIVIWHRNHLAIMSANTIVVNDTTTLYDFTTGVSKYFGNDAKSLHGGTFGMYAGDFSVDGFIDAADFVGPDNDVFLSGYRRSDLNMDGFIDGSDFVYPDNNVFKGTNVPN
ncbi:MAG: IPT/TIG domain-containing protein [Ignavibacteriae bacterium]|nr:IPT/TIG domain-containing protein [Ignavibacteriota bacterium]